MDSKKFIATGKAWNSLQMRKLSETPMDTFSVATHCLQVQTLKTLLDNQSTNGIGVSMEISWCKFLISL